MEKVLPCSDTQRAVESDRSQLNLGTSYLYQEEPINCVENREDDMFEYGGQLNDSLLKKTEGRGPTVSEILANSYCQNAGALVFDSQVENQEKPCSLHAIADNDINEPRLTSENSLSMVDLIENESPNTGREGALSFSEPAWLEGEEETMALWVKWRGTWLAGIKCVRADCPLLTLKAKPTHEQKNYFVIFFPHTKKYSWADMLLVRPIDEFPQPTAYETHQEALEIVKDLTVVRRFTMQDLALSILYTLDQLHSHALVETACDVMVWKELAMEASRCNAYSDLGRMLLKLQNSIAPRYISADWINSSFDSWAERCRNVNSAESVGLLKEEWVNSILWNDVNSLSSVPVQPTLGSEWKTWKQDVMNWFSTPYSGYQVSLQIGRERRKLQVHRADTDTSLAGTKGSDHSITLETSPGFSKNQNTVSALAIVPFEQESFREVHVETDLPSNLTDQRNEIVVEGTDSEILNSNGMELTPIDDMAGEKIMEPGTKNKQCIAYVEAKGRLCVRSPSDGDKYCCVHSRCLSSPGITKMCVGITIAGTRCKHHSLPDSPFCKKHRPSAETRRNLKRKHEGNCTPSEGLICKDMVLLNDEIPLQVIPMSANRGDCFLHKFPGKLVLSGNCHNAMEEAPRCLGSPPYDNEYPCVQSPLWYFLYCEKHLPSWLKRGRYGKTRVISKEVFTEILRDCSSWEQKVHLHTACGIFHRLFNGILSNPVSKEFQFQRTMTEAAKDPSVGELLKRLIMSEKERIKLVWGLDDDIDISSLMEGPSLVPTAINGRLDNGEFLDDRTQGNHWMDNHKKEAPRLCSSFGCAICRVSFTEKKLLENHVQERHQGAKRSDHSITLATIPGFSKNQDTVGALEIVTPELENLREVPVETDLPCNLIDKWIEIVGQAGDSEILNSNGMETTSIDAGTKNQQCVAYEVKGRQSVRSALRSARKAKKPVPIETPMCGGTTNAGNSCKHHSLPDSLFCKKHLPGAETRSKLKGKHEASCTGSEGLICKDTGPLHVDPVLAIDGGRHYKTAHMGHNKISSKLAKREAVCSAHRLISGRLSRPKFKKCSSAASYRTRSRANANLKRHIQETKSLRMKGKSVHLNSGSLQNGIVLCDDISFGQESIPVICAEYFEILNSQFQPPWESFTYVTKPRLYESLSLHPESTQMQRSCSFFTFCPETCHQAYLFDNEFDDAKDVFGKPMRGRCPYDENGRIILEEGYLVYECNNMSRCNKTCANRILQNGIRVKLEVFKTEKKGWGVRAGEAILRGTFICELLGEVLDGREAHDRRKRYGKEYCSYFYDIDARFNDTGKMIEGQGKYVIDATRYGNVSRFINSSCSPNLVSYNVFVESLDCKRSHIGLYASRDIALGEELTFDYQGKLVVGEETPCLCGSSNCRGRLH
ncbi:histone-lysine N-methyltransferase SUVR5-like isoform X2 [Lotus japonicus]|uniref:histone-lysine N-methyltransferase SUVR5-like isoform X2 n=1 Tax=Lotus japonicus TaxID=34305 RepID=UPI00258EB7CA|nr:histone-lysine N-methyltransferase SUVR5-like isoform X2 [Lotus japonicus]XP_057416487.1 histone-lysine N-methyltransferase SUVR5-like isoform X2 [Lotus japonicus]XP_057416488.1 histone-lysine N-methyltransferase SUVR5-like isoform X2 [Lotus japonicus]